NCLAGAVSPDGRWLALTGPRSRRGIELWDVGSRRAAAVLSNARDGWANVCSFSPDGKRLAVYYWDGRVKLWDLQTGRDTITLSGHDSNAFSVAFSHDGQTLATASADYTIRLWRAPRPGRDR